MQAWTAFYTVIGGASAALLGLLFIAVSVNAVAAMGPGQGIPGWPSRRSRIIWWF